MPGFEAVFAIAGKKKEENLTDYFAGEIPTRNGMLKKYNSRLF